MYPITSSLESTMSSVHPQDAAPPGQVCYRHPDRETGIRCQRCDRPTCAECRSQASVGFHCHECLKSGKTQQVFTPQTMPGADGRITKSLVAVNVLLFVVLNIFGQNSESLTYLYSQLSTKGSLIWEDNQYWRVLTGGFLHGSIIHIGFNMYLLWQLGQQIERVIGPKLFSAVYFTSLFGGSFGAILLDPDVEVVGASGAVFGLIGFTALLYRSRGIGLFDTGLGFLIVINILFSFRGGTSLGAHAGGFVIGLLLGVLFYGAGMGNKPVIKSEKAQLAVTAVLGVVFAIAGVLVSSTWTSPLF